MASKCKFPYILTVRLRARKPTIKIVGFLARKFYKNYNTFSKERQLIVSHIFILIVTVQKEKTIIPFLDDTSPI
jgi:hypothetical protein